MLHKYHLIFFAAGLAILIGCAGGGDSPTTQTTNGQTNGGWTSWTTGTLTTGNTGGTGGPTGGTTGGLHGEMIYFVKRGQAARVRPDGSTLQTLASQLEVEAIDVTPDGSKIALWVVGPDEDHNGYSDAQVWIANGDGSSAQKLLETSSTMASGNIAISPNGDKILFVDGSVGAHRMLDVSSGQVQNLTSEAVDGGVRWSPSGDTFVLVGEFYSLEEDRGWRELAIYPSSGESKTVLTSAIAILGHYSSDGSALFFSEDADAFLVNTGSLTMSACSSSASIDQLLGAPLSNNRSVYEALKPWPGGSAINLSIANLDNGTSTWLASLGDGVNMDPHTANLP